MTCIFLISFATLALSLAWTKTHAVMYYNTNVMYKTLDCSGDPFYMAISEIKTGECLTGSYWTNTGTSRMYEVIGNEFVSFQYNNNDKCEGAPTYNYSSPMKGSCTKQSSGRSYTSSFSTTKPSPFANSLKTTQVVYSKAKCEGSAIRTHWLYYVKDICIPTGNGAYTKFSSCETLGKHMYSTADCTGNSSLLGDTFRLGCIDSGSGLGSSKATCLGPSTCEKVTTVDVDVRVDATSNQGNACEGVRNDIVATFRGTKFEGVSLGLASAAYMGNGANLGCASSSGACTQQSGSSVVRKGSVMITSQGGVYHDLASAVCKGEKACKNTRFYGITKVSCIGQRSCDHAVFVDVDEVYCDVTAANYTSVCGNATFNRIKKQVVCRGASRVYSSKEVRPYACGDANITNVKGLQCVGSYACLSARIENTTGPVLCNSTSGALACGRANITNVKGLQCVGYDACFQARIENITDQQLTCDSTSIGISACQYASIYGGSNLKVTCAGFAGCSQTIFYDVQSVTCRGESFNNCMGTYFGNKNGKYDVKCLSTSGMLACYAMTCNYQNISGTQKLISNTFTSC